MIRGLPSTSRVSFEKARILSLARVLARLRWKASRSFLPAAAPQRSATADTSIFVYQTSRLPSSARRRIASLYSCAIAATIARRTRPLKPLSRPATEKLAASRFTSHSQGPGRVSSKSLTSKTSSRSGEA
jgi:hypothetical protein